MNKKKKSTNTSPYPDEVIDRLARAFYPAILACWNSEAGKENLLHGRRSRLITPPAKKNRAFPTGNALLYISLLSVVLIASFTSSAILNNLFAICNSRLLPTNQIVNCDGRVRPIQGRTLFYYASSFSARSIRYPTPTWVWIRCGASGYRSNFLRRDAM